MSEKIAQIAISNGKLAIFGSRVGYLGPVIMDYTPFKDEAEAIAAAKFLIEQEGYTLDPGNEITRPNITRMTMTTSKARSRK